MGFLDNVRDKAEELGDKAKEAFEAAKDKAADVVEDVKDRFDGDEETPATADTQPAEETPPSADTIATGTEAEPDAVGETPASLDEPVVADPTEASVDPVPPPVDTTVVTEVPEAPEAVEVPPAPTPVDPDLDAVQADSEGLPPHQDQI